MLPRRLRPRPIQTDLLHTRSSVVTQVVVWRCAGATWHLVGTVDLRGTWTIEGESMADDLDETFWGPGSVGG